MREAQNLTAAAERRDRRAGMGLIDQAIAEHKPSRVYALFSGGHDSLVNTHITAQHPAFSGVVHLNTGIGIEETRQFVRDTCVRFGWPLIELAHEDDEYRRMVLEEGFPHGAIAHRYAYIRLKERLLDRFIAASKGGRLDRIALATGARSQESRRRMGTVEPIRRDGATVWIAPIHDLTRLDVGRYVAENGLPRNPVVDHLHMSGECLCGAFAGPGEREMIRFFYPEVIGRLESLEADVYAAGKWPNWGARRPGSFEHQGTLQPFLPLCADCPTRWEASL